MSSQSRMNELQLSDMFLIHVAYQSFFSPSNPLTLKTAEL